MLTTHKTLAVIKALGGVIHFRDLIKQFGRSMNALDGPLCSLEDSGYICWEGGQITITQEGRKKVKLLSYLRAWVEVKANGLTKKTSESKGSKQVKHENHWFIRWK